MDEKLSELAARLKAAFPNRIVSAILYGSAAMGDWDEANSDLNILCVLDRLSLHELVQSEPISRWWREKGNPTPLLMSEDEVRNSTDCFPMEFHDMQAHRRVLLGKDMIGALVINPRFYRAQVEHELRSKQIRLRQKGAELISNRSELLKLLTSSISTFCVLGRHAMLLSGREARWTKRQILTALAEALSRQFEGASAILAVRESVKPPRDVDALALFESYLGEMNSLVQFVDALDG